MLKRNHRLRKKDLSRLFKKGETRKINKFFVRFLLNKYKHPRFAVIISKNIFSKASQRNRIRRLIFNVLKENIQDFKKNIDLSLTLKKEIAEEEIEENIQEILKIFK